MGLLRGCEDLGKAWLDEGAHVVSGVWGSLRDGVVYGDGKSQKAPKAG